MVSAERFETEGLEMAVYFFFPEAALWSMRPGQS